MLTVADLITRGAIERKESRGGHFREDFPDKDPEATKFNVVIQKGEGGEMTVTRQPLKPIRDDLQQIIEENK